MRITALQSQMKNPERVNVFIDGHFTLSVNVLIIEQMGLEVGQELSTGQLEELRRQAALQQALDRALNFLTYRPRSRQELRHYLRRKDTPPEVIETVLERLDHLDLVNDRDFASFWVENREQFSPRGAHALRQELRMKGVQREIVDELIDEEQDEERALRAGRKKAHLLVHQPGMDYVTFQRRLGPFLQRRGFGYEATSHAVKKLWQELKGEESSDHFD